MPNALCVSVTSTTHVLDSRGSYRRQGKLLSESKALHGLTVIGYLLVRAKSGSSPNGYPKSPISDAGAMSIPESLILLGLAMKHNWDYRTLAVRWDTTCHVNCATCHVLLNTPYFYGFCVIAAPYAGLSACSPLCCNYCFFFDR